VTDPGDDVDTWLQKQIDPMLPPPGTFELIRKRARRRKARQALVSAASAGVVAALVVLAVVALPKVVPSVLNPHNTPAANGDLPPASASQHAILRSPSPSASTTVPNGPPGVPANFQATSVTFVGTQTGWVIGQAGTPGDCATQYCTSVARTDNTGGSWYGVPAPKTGAPDGSTGVGQIRFLNEENGWAFGPALWSTHNGGQSWAQVATGGLRVVSLETVGSEAFAIFGDCSGAGADYASGCTSYTLYSSPATVDHWQPVPGMSAVPAQGASATTGSSVSLVLTPSAGYFYTPDGTILSGPVSGTAAWTAVSEVAPPCVPGSPAGSAQQPSTGLLASSGPSDDDLALACTSAVSGSTSQQVVIYSSDNSGASWDRESQTTLSGQATSLAASSGGELLLAWTGGLDASTNNGTSWTTQEQGVPGGFSYVGLTDSAQGVAVPEQPQQQAVWFTLTGGQSWLVSGIRS
jgi:hypothetical protein